MTLAGAAVATFAAALVLVGLTGGCGNPTDTRHYDEPAVTALPAGAAHRRHRGLGAPMTAAPAYLYRAVVTAVTTATPVTSGPTSVSGSPTTSTAA
jgi:hypothetical protein